ncbi:unnamed protein product, partial [Staurois parvus]
DWHLWGGGGSRYLSNSGTHSHVRCDRLGDWKWKSSSPPHRSLLGCMTGPRRLQDHSQSAALLGHVQ